MSSPRCFLLSVFGLLACAGPPVYGQGKVAEAPLSLAKAAEHLAKKASGLRLEVPDLIEKILAANEEDSPAVQAFVAHHVKVLEAELHVQALLNLQVTLGNTAAPGQKTPQGWLDQAEKLAPRLPKPPAPQLWPDVSAIDKHALAAPAHVSLSPKALAAYLGKGAKSDFEKARAIYVWMGNNLAYDADAVQTGKLTEATENILERGRTICPGFALTYEVLGRYTGLELWTVRGYHRTVIPRAKDPRTFYTPTGIAYVPHDWNAIKIGGKMYLVDPTHGNGRRYERGKTVIERPTDFGHFLVPAEVMIAHNVPFDERWQLLKTPLKKKEHEALPLLKPGSSAYEVRVHEPRNPSVVALDQLLIKLQAPADVLVSGVVKSSANELTPVLVQRRDDKVFLRAAFAAPGTYQVFVNAQRPEDGKSFSGVLRYRVEAKASSPDVPQTLAAFKEKKSYLYHPLTRKLVAKQTQGFAIAIPGASSAYLKTGERTEALQKRGELFVGHVALEPGPATLFARFGDTQVLTGLVRFSAD